MIVDLKERVALVTGASKGIGKAIAVSLARSGACVILCARQPESLQQLAAEIKGSSGMAFAVPVDATDPASVSRAVGSAISLTGKLDILVNNVGGAIRFGGFENLTDNDWENAFNLNVMSMVYFVRSALPWLGNSSSPRIINISSISGVEPGNFNPHYTTTKAATINLTKILANSLASQRILVNVVCPGPVHSDLWEANISQTADRLSLPIEEARRKVELEESRKVPLGRIGEGEDIAGLVTYLASDEASWITGACFHVNGGKTRSI